LPAGTVETLVKPESKATLTKILTYHVVAGNMTADKIMAAIKAGKGTATLKTVSGGTRKAMMNGPKKCGAGRRKRRRVHYLDLRGHPKQRRDSRYRQSVDALSGLPQPTSRKRLPTREGAFLCVHHAG
jgi:hypothetical protein